MELQFIRKDYEIDCASNLVSFTNLIEFSNLIGCKFGPILKEYILTYGYIGYKSIEFYGINIKQREKSDLISQTLYLHKYYPKTHGLIAFENQGDGYYYLVDKNDMMFCYNSELDQLTEAHLSLVEYILKRFEEVS